MKPAKIRDACKFCGERVDLDNEGVTYKSGECAHEDCDDQADFERENAADFRD